MGWVLRLVQYEKLCKFVIVPVLFSNFLVHLTDMVLEDINLSAMIGAIMTTTQHPMKGRADNAPFYNMKCGMLLAVIISITA